MALLNIKQIFWWDHYYRIKRCHKFCREIST